MNVDEVLTIFRSELRNVEWRGEKLEQLSEVTRRSSTDGIQNSVIAFDVDEESAGKAILSQIDHFRRLNREFEWKVFSFDSPVDLVLRLGRLGFIVGNKEAVVAYDVASGLEPFEGSFDCKVVHVCRTKQLADYRHVAEEIFKKDYSFTIDQLGEALQKGLKGHDAYIAYHKTRPVAIGRLYTDPNSQFAGLYGGGTLAEFRGRGFYRAILRARAQDAKASGARYLQVDALPTSLPILIRLGFKRIADTWPCSFTG